VVDEEAKEQKNLAECLLSNGNGDPTSACINSYNAPHSPVERITKIFDPTDPKTAKMSEMATSQ
jgi:hypothetical protein